MGGKEVFRGKDNILQRAPGCGGDGRHPAASVLNAEPPRHHVVWTICCRQSQTLFTPGHRVGTWISHKGWVLGGKTLPSDPSGTKYKQLTILSCIGSRQKIRKGGKQHITIIALNTIRKIHCIKLIARHVKENNFM